MPHDALCDKGVSCESQFAVSHTETQPYILQSTVCHAAKPSVKDGIEASVPAPSHVPNYTPWRAHWK